MKSSASPAPAARLGGHILVDQLVAQGVEHVFCVPGESYLAVLDGLHDTERGLMLEGWAQSQLIQTKDFAEGVQAAVQRRPAEFRGE